MGSHVIRTLVFMFEYAVAVFDQFVHDAFPIELGNAYLVVGIASTIKAAQSGCELNAMAAGAQG